MNANLLLAQLCHLVAQYRKLVRVRAKVRVRVRVRVRARVRVRVRVRVKGELGAQDARM